MKAVLDTCILKLASLPNPHNPTALIVKLCWDGLLECWASPAMQEEYSVVLADEPELLALVQDRFQVCYPLVELDCVKHEPDNRFVECALAIDADYLVTVNTARGHFDKPAYGRTRVVTPGAFLNLPDVQRLLRKV
ncbi:MAG: PIN domain-containing protein [Verrucomicrobia bacterium]|nr:PIN domain-containing protein [Verrucomicrobiota bacterium]